MRKVLWVVCLMIAVAASTRGDEVLLKNGNIHRGDILTETDKSVTIKIFFSDPKKDPEAYAKIEVPKERIRRITRGSSLFKGVERKNIVPETPTSTETEMVGRVEEESENAVSPTTKTPASAPTPAAPGEKPIDPALQAQIDMLTGQLASTNEDVRKRAEQQLQAMGKDAVPSLANVLQRKPSRRALLSATRILGESRVKEVVRLLIDQLKGGKADRVAMRTAHTALKKITGQSIYFNEEYSLQKRSRDRQKWLDWFETVAEKYPSQIGYEQPATDGTAKPQTKPGQAKPSYELR